MPRGGPRIGAGAPRGNLNAVKHGRYAIRLHALTRAIASVPEIRDFLLEVRRRQRRHERQAAAIARQALIQIVSANLNPANPLLLYLIAGGVAKKTIENSDSPLAPSS